MQKIYVFNSYIYSLNMQIVPHATKRLRNWTHGGI